MNRGPRCRARSKTDPYADAGHSARLGLRVRFAGVVTQAASRGSSGAVERELRLQAS
jgi:hypothetical protein